MDGQFSWKRTEEIEIDLADLLRRLFQQWKWILICALASALLTGGYRWLKERNAVNTNVSEQAAETVLTKEEEQRVADAVQLENEIRGLETYLDNSVLMQLDPYHKAKFVMLYGIDQAERQEIARITESYLNYVLNGGAVEALTESGSGWEMDKSYLAELISAYQKTYSFPYQIVADSKTDSTLMLESLFCIEIAGRNIKETEKMSLDLQKVLEEYSDRVKESAGNHRLMLVSSMGNIIADSGLQSQQHDKKALLSTYKTNLKAMTDAFSKEQISLYKEKAGMEAEKEEKEVSEADAADENNKSGIIYVFLGFLGGIFVYCGIFSCWYLLRDTVKSIEEIKRMYTFPFYGGITLETKKKIYVREMPVKQQDDCGRDIWQILNRIRLACKKMEITKLYAVSDFSFTMQERVCLESMAKQLKSWKIDMTVADNVIKDSSEWDSLAETGNVLMVYRIGTTTHQMIDDTMKFFLENEINVTGAAAFLKNK